MRDMTFQGGDRWADKTESAIEAAARFGYFLHFISHSSLRSPWVSHEMERALALDIGSRYIPIVLDPPAILTNLLPPFVRERFGLITHTRMWIKCFRLYFEHLEWTPNRVTGTDL